MGAVTKILMTCCSATFECVDTNRHSMVSSALQERNRVLAGFSQGSGVIDPRQRPGHRNGQTRAREYLTPTEVERLVKAVGENRSPAIRLRG